MLGPIKEERPNLKLPSKKEFEEIVATCWAILLATGAAIVRAPFLPLLGHPPGEMLVRCLVLICWPC